MATYIYETTDPAGPVRHFELQQSMKDAPLTAHPETGEPIRRVITGGYGYIAKGGGDSGAASAAAAASSCCARGGCGCG
jgi:predicted nucleic acid-binding Zn ribbon protein